MDRPPQQTEAGLFTLNSLEKEWCLRHNDKRRTRKDNSLDGKDKSETLGRGHTAPTARQDRKQWTESPVGKGHGALYECDETPDDDLGFRSRATLLHRAVAR